MITEACMNDKVINPFRSVIANGSVYLWDEYQLKLKDFNNYSFFNFRSYIVPTLISNLPYIPF